MKLLPFWVHKVGSSVRDTTDFVEQSIVGDIYAIDKELLQDYSSYRYWLLTNFVQWFTRVLL